MWFKTTILSCHFFSIQKLDYVVISSLPCGANRGSSHRFTLALGPLNLLFLSSCTGYRVSLCHELCPSAALRPEALSSLLSLTRQWMKMQSLKKQGLKSNLQGGDAHEKQFIPEWWQGRPSGVEQETGWPLQATLQPAQRLKGAYISQSTSLKTVQVLSNPRQKELCLRCCVSQRSVTMAKRPDKNKVEVKKFIWAPGFTGSVHSQLTP